MTARATHRTATPGHGWRLTRPRHQPPPDQAVCDQPSCDQPRCKPGNKSGAGERGAAAIEFLLISPVLFLIVLLLVQWTVRLEAERAVNAAAREGAVAAASWDGDEAAGRATAMDYLTRLDPQLTDRSARVVLRAEEAEVTVEADVLSLIPLVDLHVSATATAPTERFVD